MFSAASPPVSPVLSPPASPKRSHDLVDSPGVMLRADDPEFPDPDPTDQAGVASEPRVTRRRKDGQAPAGPEVLPVMPQHQVVAAMAKEEQRQQQAREESLERLERSWDGLEEEIQGAKAVIKRQQAGVERLRAGTADLFQAIKEASSREIAQAELDTFVKVLAAVPLEPARKLFPKLQTKVAKSAMLERQLQEEQQKMQELEGAQDQQREELEQLRQSVRDGDDRVKAMQAAAQALLTLPKHPFGECVACCENAATHVMPTCSHLCLCEQCVFTIMNPDPDWDEDDVEEGLEQRQRCPMCRAAFDGGIPKKVICSS